MKLSIITLTLPERAEELRALREELLRQRADYEVEHVIVSDDGSTPYGTKMRKALEACTGDYVAAVDDDDWVAEDYVHALMQALDADKDLDVVTFDAVRVDLGKVWSFRTKQEDGSNPTEKGQGMMANHFCAWKRDLALSSPWLPVNYGAEVCWYTVLNASRERFREIHLDRVLYEYRYDPARTMCQTPEHTLQALRLFDGGIRGWRTADGFLVASRQGHAHRREQKGQEQVVFPDGSMASVPLDRLTELVSVRLM